jgi:hypothetical protein
LFGELRTRYRPSVYWRLRVYHIFTGRWRCPHIAKSRDRRCLGLLCSKEWVAVIPTKGPAHPASMHEEGTTAGSRPSWSLQSIPPQQKHERLGTGSHRSLSAETQYKACGHEPHRPTGQAWASTVSTTSVIGDVGNVECALMSV